MEYDREFRSAVEEFYERELTRFEGAADRLTPEEASYLYAVHSALTLGNYGLAERMLATYRSKRPKHWVSDWLKRPAPPDLTVAGLRAGLHDIRGKK